MELSVTSTSITEPVTNAQVKTFMGYPSTETSQDTLIDSMITTAREWLEKRTALSLVIKSYKAYYDEDEAENGWYLLPVSPVDLTADITVKMNGISTTFQQRGMKQIRIAPDAVFGTILIGISDTTPYIEIEFDAGEDNSTANQCLLELVSYMFNNRGGGATLSIASIPYSLVSKINSISNNLV